MISYLKGHPISVGEESFILDVKGVGYEVFSSRQTLDEIEGQGEQSVFVYTHVRQDTIQLFGFVSMLEKKLFLSLLKVSGIGPKMATGILSGASTDRILQMIDQADVRALTQLPKVGKKKAEQIVFSLKGQVLGDRFIEPMVNGRAEIVSALVHLGFRLSEVEPVVDKMSEDMSVQEGIRLGLAALTNPIEWEGQR